MSMSCSVCATRPLRLLLQSFGCSTSATSTSRPWRGARRRHSINTASNLPNPSGDTHNLNSSRIPGRGSFDVACIPKGGFAVGRNLLFRRPGRATFRTASLEGNRSYASSHVEVSFRKFDMRDGPRERSGGLLKRVPSPMKRSVAASDNAQFERRERAPWQMQKSALSEKFGSSGWSPRKRLSPDSLEGIRTLHAQYPDRYTTPVLAEQFKVSPEAIRRILKSKWRPNDEEEDDRRERWNRRGMNIWFQMNELGIKPPKKWRDQGVGKFERGQQATNGQSEPSSRATREVWSDTHRSSEYHTAIPAARRESGQVPLADRIL